MALDFTINIQYDPNKDIYFINGSRSELNEKKKSLIDPTALLVRVLNFSSRQFKTLDEAIAEINAMEMKYIIRSFRPGENEYSHLKSKES